jgi:hypothetical protein
LHRAPCDGLPFGSSGLSLFLVSLLAGSLAGFLGGAALAALEAAIGSALGFRLGGSRRLLEGRLGFLCGSLVIPASPPSDLAGCSAFAFFLRSFFSCFLLL